MTKQPPPKPAPPPKRGAWPPPLHRRAQPRYEVSALNNGGLSALLWGRFCVTVYPFGSGWAGHEHSALTVKGAHRIGQRHVRQIIKREKRQERREEALERYEKLKED